MVTVPVFNAFASETDSEQIEYCMSGPAVARELNADGTEHIIVGKPGPVTVKKTHKKTSEPKVLAVTDPSMLAVIDPSHHKNDVDPDKPKTLRDHVQNAGNIILDIASNFVPYGGSIMNLHQEQVQEQRAKHEDGDRDQRDHRCRHRSPARHRGAGRHRCVRYRDHDRQVDLLLIRSRLSGSLRPSRCGSGLSDPTVI